MKHDTSEPSDNEQGLVHPDPVMDAALDWFTRLQGYPDDQGLKAAFEKWQMENVAHAKAFDQVAGVWNLRELDIIAADLSEKHDFARSSQGACVASLVRPRRRVWAKTMLAIAAALLIAVCIPQYQIFNLQLRSDYITSTGSQEQITLPDGSRMTLNTASAVSLDFEGNKRSVTLLQGEAYFDVVSDASRPFIVEATLSRVEVKGTAFSVRTTSDKDTVILERGIVDVSLLQAANDRAVLHPGETISATATALSPVDKIDTATMLAWREGRIIFTGQPFGQVLEEIGRYYDHSIFVLNDQLKQKRLSGNYRLDHSERTVRSLATAAGATVTRLPGGILILR